MTRYDVIIVGGGAAGLMCAIEATRRGRKVLILERSEKVGKKILISGGGRCNFTNMHISPDAYISNNEHFCKSALSRYTQWDFLALFEKHQLNWHEKTLGQLFCDQKSKAVLNMLKAECNDADIKLNLTINEIQFDKNYRISTNQGVFESKALVIATGGPSIPKMGATNFGLQVAKQFNINTYNFSPALVPFIFDKTDINLYFKDLSGLSFEGIVSCREQAFRENMLITHRGISGPAVLQISSYWKSGDKIFLNLLPDINAAEYLVKKQSELGSSTLKTILSNFFAKRLSARLVETLINKSLANIPLAQLSKKDLIIFGETLNKWTLQPTSTEGLRTAEVCTGGVDTDELSSKTMESNKQPGLYFIGETVDVTGWLGGYNFQWAWSSGWAAGQVV